MCFVWLNDLYTSCHLIILFFKEAMIFGSWKDLSQSLEIYNSFVFINSVQVKDVLLWIKMRVKMRLLKHAIKRMCHLPRN